jgi:protein transporter SFT1
MYGIPPPGAAGLSARLGAGSSSYSAGDGAAGPSGQVQISIGGRHADVDEQIAGLRGDVARLKHMARSIDEERTLQGEAIKALEESMERARLVLRRASRRLTVVSRQARGNPLLALALFSIALFGVVFGLKKLHSLGRMVGLFGRKRH